MSASDAGWCLGCNRYFASAQAFAIHAFGTSRPYPSMPRRWRSLDEMRALGLGRQPGSHAWSVILQKPR